MDRLVNWENKAHSTHFHRSTTAMAVLKSKQSLLPQQKLINDLPTTYGCRGCSSVWLFFIEKCTASFEDSGEFSLLKKKKCPGFCSFWVSGCSMIIFKTSTNKCRSFTPYLIAINITKCEDPLGIKLSMLETAILFNERRKVTKVLKAFDYNIKGMVTHSYNKLQTWFCSKLKYNNCITSKIFLSFLVEMFDIFEVFCW